MARAGPRHFEAGAQFWGQRVPSQEQQEKMSQGESHQEMQEGLGFLRLQMQAPQALGQTRGVKVLAREKARRPFVAALELPALGQGPRDGSQVQAAITETDAEWNET